MKRKPKVVVAMSGGVDSSVAAALLKKQGYEVIGIFMRFWSETPKDNIPLDDFINRCCSFEAEKSARAAAKMLKIPFYSINAASQFKKTVVDYFLKEYQAARTPNPCTVCNREIKFKFLLDKARKFGAGFIATGHYARVRYKSGGYHLLKAKDKNKDQSYFLYAITQEQLAHYLFPVGEYSKPEIRQMAKKFKLPAWDRAESQEICFISDNDIRRFLAEHLKLKPGKIIDSEGRVLGEHPGLSLFTIGQRRGLGVGGGKPYYVVASDRRKNRLIVSSNPKDKLLYRKFLVATNVNWISGEAPKTPLKCEAAVRYRHKSEKAIIKFKEKNKHIVDFAKPQRAVASGQAAVFYKGDEVLGGGVISE